MTISIILDYRFNLIFTFFTQSNKRYLTNAIAGIKDLCILKKQSEAVDVLDQPINPRIFRTYYMKHF